MSEADLPPSAKPAETGTGVDPVPVEQPEQTLTELGRELKFFTPALLMTHGYFDRDILLAFIAQNPHDDPNMQPIAADIDYPLFQGLRHTRLGNEIVDWNRRLYMLHESRFELLTRFMLSVSVKDPVRKRLLKIEAHWLPIVDVLAMPKIFAGELPMVSITVFCINSNAGFVRMLPAANPPLTKPYPSVEPAQAAMIREAAAFFPPPQP